MWFGDITRLPPGILSLDLYQAYPTGWRHWHSPRTGWRYYISQLAWEHQRIPKKALESVAGDREVWADFYRLLPTIHSQYLLVCLV